MSTEPKRRGRKPKIQSETVYAAEVNPDDTASPKTREAQLTGGMDEAYSKWGEKLKECADTPKAPEMDPAQGDKTPAFVEWMRDFHPEKFSKRYANRKTHLTEKNAE